MSSNNLDLPFLAVVPFRIQKDDLIPDSVKLFFGQIVGLSRKCGYIWATDDTLAEMKNTSVRNIQRWLLLLEQQGYLTRQTQNIPIKKEGSTFHWEKKRKIFINNAFVESPIIPINDSNEYDPFSNNPFEPAKNGESIEPAKNGESIEPAKNGGITNNPLDESIKEQPEAVILSLQDLNISDKLKIKITKEHSKEDIDLAVKRCLKWKTRTSDEIGIFTTLSRKDEWDDTASKEEKIEENIKYLRSLTHLDGIEMALVKINISNKYVEFIRGMKSDCYNVDDNNFKKDVNEYLELLNRMKDVIK